MASHSYVRVPLSEDESLPFHNPTYETGLPTTAPPSFRSHAPSITSSIGAPDTRKYLPHSRLSALSQANIIDLDDDIESMMTTRSSDSDPSARPLRLVSELMARLDRIESAMTMQVGRSEDSHICRSCANPMLPGSKEGEVDSARKFWQTETWDYFCNLFWIVVAVAVGVAFVAGFLVIAYARATNKSGAHDPVP